MLDRRNRQATFLRVMNGYRGGLVPRWLDQIVFVTCSQRRDTNNRRPSQLKKVQLKRVLFSLS
jgi:hypothetical protein